MGRKPLHPKPDNEPLPPDPVEDEKPDTLPFLFLWYGYRPDQREYRQQSIELTPEDLVHIQVDVPADPIYIIPNEKKMNILTLTGLRYIIDQFDAIFLSNKKEVVSSPDDEWEKEPEGVIERDSFENTEFDDNNEKKTASSSNDDEWETEPEDKNETDKMPWDEANEEWS